MSHMHPCKTKPGQQTYLVPKTAGRTTTSDSTHYFSIHHHAVAVDNGGLIPI